MAQVAVIGEAARVQGFMLAGARVLVAEDPDAARAAWRGLTDPRSAASGDVAVVVLSPMAATALTEELRAQRWPLTAVMPQ